MNADAQKVRSIFLAAVENHAPSQWEFYLDQACAGDHRVEVLLRGHQQPNSLLDCPAPASAGTIDEPLTERPGTVIGPYKLLEQIGEGGFGVVFMDHLDGTVYESPGSFPRGVQSRWSLPRRVLQ